MTELPAIIIIVVVLVMAAVALDKDFWFGGWKK
jgi:hypothetical protein